ncbi:hypothetical protein [Sphingopyxis sp. 113P3]|mgnify:CR=1 FL=1|jgi:hypothetical protein|uniref:hypothetical protein n=1 Tax=Sphingopyxis sp. (strain 113P3) TaxID=292913 RepID=UPI0006AD4D36|nr:hypothetical protein [Sphingopyxis sp. 113P3]ALC12241.1 hypothetical protein LH20_09790 [Sphingopyxis sp. 113P3]
MSVNSRIIRFTQWHLQLDEAVQREARQRGATFRLLRLQALRLTIKQRLAALMRRPLSRPLTG